MRGEVGVGKSWLCRRTAAASSDFTVVELRGVPSESHLAYAGLFDALSPLLELLESLPASQAVALRAALRLDAAADADPLAVDVACHALLAAGGEQQPLLLVVDDAQWVDEASVEALRFSARRLGARRAALLFALRTGGADPFVGAGLEVLELRGLAEREALPLVYEVAGPGLSTTVARQLVAATGGNPLALRKAVQDLSSQQRAGTAPLPDPPAMPGAIQEAFGQRLAVLPEPARCALVVAAADAAAPSGVFERALATFGLGPSALDPAVAHALISLDGDRPRFSHPLVRAAAYHGEPASVQRAAQQALAAAWAQADAEHEAGHLAEAVQGPNPDAPRALAAAGRGGRERGPEEAAQAFRPAGQIPGDQHDRARLLFEAACELARTARGPRMLQLLDNVVACDPPPDVRSEAELLRGRTLMWHGAPNEAHRVLMAEAARIEAADPARAVQALCEAAVSRAMAGDIGACLDLARSAHVASARLEPARAAKAALTLGFALVLNGEGKRGYPRYVDSLDAAAGSLGPGHPGLVACWMEDYELARRSLREAIDSARDGGALAELSSALSYQSELDFRTGDWQAARAHAAEAVKLARETELETSYVLVVQTRLDAAIGRDTDAQRNAETALATGLDSLALFATAALGLLELGGGCPERATTHLVRTARFAQACGIEEPNLLRSAPDLIEAQIRAGHVTQARQTLVPFERQAQRAGRPWANAAAARCRGLLAGGEGELDRAFAEAARWQQHVPSPFEAGRTELCWGESLKRQGRRVEADNRLDQALERFQALGAEPWSERAARELRASGERGHRGPRPRSGELTGHELQIALLVAEGLTNKEVAGRLFLSPKTIEFHLARIYRKLNIRSRVQLTRLITPTTTARNCSGCG